MTKDELIAFIRWQLHEQQFSIEEKNAHHYGRVELAQLVNKIFPGPIHTLPRDFHTRWEGSHDEPIVD